MTAISFKIRETRVCEKEAPWLHGYSARHGAEGPRVQNTVCVRHFSELSLSVLPAGNGYSALFRGREGENGEKG